MIRNLFGRGERDEALEVGVASVAVSRANDSVQIVDVREPEEWHGGHIPGALHIPLGELAARRGQLDPQRSIVTVCRSGQRSLRAAKHLRQAGASDAVSMAGGMLAWERAGLPTTR